MKLQKLICVMLIALLGVAGCATPRQNGQASGDDNTALRCAALGVGGAILGALIGGKNSALKGAAVGLAACAVIEITSKQTKTAEDVDKQYKVNNRGILPATAKVDQYVTTVSPNGVAKAGDAIKVQSSIRVVAGTKEPIQEIKEVLVAYAPTGEEFKRGEKKVNETNGSGEYDNSFVLRLPAGAPQGIYRLTTQVFLNGHLSNTQESKLQIAANSFDKEQSFAFTTINANQ